MENLIKCLVCSCEVGADRTFCPNCSSCYHSDCWSYAGHCSVYGCQPVASADVEKKSIYISDAQKKWAELVEYRFDMCNPRHPSMDEAYTSLVQHLKEVYEITINLYKHLLSAYLPLCVAAVAYALTRGEWVSWFRETLKLLFIFWIVYLVSSSVEANK